MPLGLGIGICLPLASGTIMVGGDEVEPLIFLDFKNGVYTADGVPVTLAEVLAQDLDFGPYEANDVVNGVGLVGDPVNASSPVVIGDALDLVLQGSTAVYTFVLGASAASQRLDLELLDSTDYNLYYYSTSGSYTGGGVNFIGDQDSSDISEVALAAGTHIKAVTMTNGKISRSTDGGAVISIDPAIAWTPPPEILHLAIGQNAVLESVGFYPPQDDADLPALSENGFPVLVSAPVITGVAQVGQTLSISTGTWTGATSYAYQWFSFSFFADFAIPGATSNTYEIAGDYEGVNLRCKVYATNATGTSITGVVDDDAVLPA